MDDNQLPDSNPLTENVTVEVKELGADSNSMSGGERRKQWVNFFDTQRYKQYLALARQYQFAEGKSPSAAGLEEEEHEASVFNENNGIGTSGFHLPSQVQILSIPVPTKCFVYGGKLLLLAALRGSFKDTDSLSPPVDLPPPVEAVATVISEEEDVTYSQSGTSLESHLSVTSGLTSALTCTTTGSFESSLESDKALISKRRERTVVFVVFGVFLILTMSISVGVILHFHLDRGIFSGQHSSSQDYDMDSSYPNLTDIFTTVNLSSFSSTLSTPSPPPVQFKNPHPVIPPFTVAPTKSGYKDTTAVPSLSTTQVANSTSSSNQSSSSTLKDLISDTNETSKDLQTIKVTQSTAGYEPLAVNSTLDKSSALTVRPTTEEFEPQTARSSIDETSTSTTHFHPSTTRPLDLYSATKLVFNTTSDELSTSSTGVIPNSTTISPLSHFMGRGWDIPVQKEATTTTMTITEPPTQESTKRPTTEVVTTKWMSFLGIQVPIKAETQTTTASFPTSNAYATTTATTIASTRHATNATTSSLTPAPQKTTSSLTPAPSRTQPTTQHITQKPTPARTIPTSSQPQRPASTTTTETTTQRPTTARKTTTTRRPPITQRPSTTRQTTRKSTTTKKTTRKPTTTTTTTTSTTTTTTTTTTIPTTTTTTTTTTTPYVPPTTLDPYAAFYGGGSPDGAGGMFGGFDFGFGGGADFGGPGGKGEMTDYDVMLRDMPPPEKLPEVLASKMAATAPPLTTRAPPPTPKPPEIKMEARDVIAEIGMSPSSNLKVECTAKKAWGWTYMSLSRYEGDSDFSLEFLGGIEKKDEWPFIPIDSRMSDFSLHRDDEQVTLALETKYALCEDKGRYLCEVIVNRTFFSKTFNVDIRKKPEPPVLTFPEDIFTGETVWMVTTWDAGNPVIGHIIHEIIRGYRGLPYAAKNEVTVSRRRDCAVWVENKYQVTPDMSWNGTELMARIIPIENATLYEENVIQRVKSDRKVMVIIDRDICKGKLYQQIPHPYTCHKYITCFQKPQVSNCPQFHCYDPLAKECKPIAL